MQIIFDDNDYQKMEIESRRLLGWTFTDKFGISVKDMILNPEKGKVALKEAKKNSGFIDRIKINKILGYLEKPNWKELLHKKLNVG